MAFWLANQSVRHRIENRRGHLFAPLVDTAGKTRPGYTNMTALRAGDVVLAFSKGSIRAIGKVLSEAVKVNQRPSLPDELLEEQEVSGRLAQGWKADVEYFYLEHPVQIRSIDERFRIPLHGPFTAGKKRWGTILQGQYLMPLSRDFVMEIHKLSSDSWPTELAP